ncbi:MAG: CDP-glycerol glycerophosphotransferase family protein [Micrococcales bacterium]|nr:CDP-glycerol glycerophosphotransferase family protein [Micrococcales bacterium]
MSKTMAKVQRRALSLGVGAIRRSGLLPKSFPDGLGDDKKLLGRSLKAEVVVYFADTVRGLYQIEPWYGALRQLHLKHKVVIFGTDSRCIRRIRQDSGLPAFTLSHYATADDLISRSPIRLVLYVNHNSGNFFMLRFPNLVHVSIMHGDSDKVVSISNQTKAYDYTFVAGQAAIDRLETYLPRFDAAGRCLIIGRPQVETPGLTPTHLEQNDHAAGLRTVLYAPTWEGGVPSAAYSSLQALGRPIVERILAHRDYRLVYRPHPLTGVRLAEFAETDQTLRQLVERAAAARPEPDSHQVSLGGDAMVDLAKADLLISDVSSLAIDFLPFNRPMLVTRPTAPGVVTAATRLMQTVPRLDPDGLDQLMETIDRQISSDPDQATRAATTTYYLGQVEPGASTKAFVGACSAMIDLANASRSAVAARVESRRRGRPAAQDDPWPVAQQFVKEASPSSGGEAA